MVIVDPLPLHSQAQYPIGKNIKFTVALNWLFWTTEEMISFTTVTKVKVVLKWPSLFQPIGINARDIKVNYVLTSHVA